jgi:uncharacterized protein
VMYNGLISGVSLDGMAFFYQNPLEADGKTKLYQDQVGRAPWFEVSCCPPNVTRFLPSVPGYVYSTQGDAVYVNLFMAGTASLEVAGTTVSLVQETRYPWDGNVRIAVAPEKSAAFALRLRIPGWARNEPVPTGLYRFADANDEKPSLKINGAPAPLTLDGGYAVIRRTWTKGDTIEVVFPMPVRRVVAHPSVQADAGRVAIQRGPLVFCAEGVDNAGRALDLAIPDAARFTAEFRPELLNGVVVLNAKVSLGVKARAVVLIPYYAWANRGPGEMRVWFPRQ